MKGPPFQAGAELIQERVRGYARYAEILEEQEAAADAGDLDRFEELGRELVALESVLGGLPVSEPAPRVESSGADAPTADAAGSEDEIRSLLERAAATQRRVTEKLRVQRDAARAEIRQMDGRADQVRSYLRERAPASGRVNVRF